jgi:hypothetical protein
VRRLSSCLAHAVQPPPVGCYGLRGPKNLFLAPPAGST